MQPFISQQWLLCSGWHLTLPKLPRHKKKYFVYSLSIDENFMSMSGKFFKCSSVRSVSLLLRTQTLKIPQTCLM